MPWALLAATQQPTDDNRPTDAVSHQLALNELRSNLKFCQGKPLPSSPLPPSAVMEKQRTKACKAGLTSQNFQTIGQQN